MDKAHDIQKAEFIGTTMLLRIDGKKYEIKISEWSERLAMATQDQRERVGTGRWVRPTLLTFALVIFWLTAWQRVVDSAQ